MALPTQMPLCGSASAPKFDGKTPLLLPRFLEDVDILGTATTLTDAAKVWTSIHYADLEESEGWELLPEAIVIPADWAAFTLTITALYPGCEGANCYCQADLQYLVQEYKAKPMQTLADFSEYKRKFMKIAQFLINGRFLSELNRNTYFPKGLPADLETQVQYQLLITNTVHHPSNPYPIADTAMAALFLLTGTALQPFASSSPTAYTPAQSYYPAWALQAYPSASPQPLAPVATPAIKQEQLALCQTGPQLCAFCADPTHFMGSCPHVEGYIWSGQATRGTDNRIHLPDGRWIPCVPGTSCLKDCLD